MACWCVSVKGLFEALSQVSRGQTDELPCLYGVSEGADILWAGGWHLSLQQGPIQPYEDGTDMHLLSHSSVNTNCQVIPASPAYPFLYFSLVYKNAVDDVKDQGILKGPPCVDPNLYHFLRQKTEHIL